MNNAADTTVLSSLGLGWLLSIDWVFWTGLVIGLATIFLRFLEWRESKRENDLKERELNERGQ
ncbi:MAG: hypothetical protein AAGJ90_19725 [Pseudomonadota bacterium]